MSISTTESFSQRLNPEMPIETYLLKTWKQIGKVQIEHIGEIAQDNIDYLCIGSDRGLLRFDGSQIKAFNFRNPDGEYLNLEEPQYYAKQQFWWKTPVATVAFVLLILLVVILIFRLRTIKKQGVLLKQKVDQQTAELLELNKNLEKKVEGRTHENSEIYMTLVKKEERLSLALEKTNTGLFEWYPASNKTYFSTTWFTMLGFESGELPENYETWANLLHPEDRSVIEKTLDEFVKLPENSFTAEFRMRTKQGEYIWIYDHGVAVDRDEDGHLIRMIGIHSDITKRKLIEEEIRLKETRYQSFVANSDEHVWCVEFSVPVPLDLPEREQVEHILEYGYYSEVNKAFAEMYGATMEEVIGWPLAKTLPRSLPTTVPFLLEVIRSGYKMVDAESIETTKEGIQVYILNSFVGTIENEKVLRVWGTARDITALKQSEIELKKSEKSYRQIFDSMFEMFQVIELIYDEDGNAIDYYFLQVNPAFEKFANKKKPELIGKRAKSIFGIVEDHWIKLYERVDKTGKPESYEGYGEELKKYYRVKAWKSDNRQVAVAFNDITESKRAKEEIEKTKKYLQHTIDGLSESVVLLDENGVILFTNQSWQEFGENNGAVMERVSKGVNYFDACKNTEGIFTEEEQHFAERLEKLNTGEITSFTFEYPCNSPGKERWFVCHATSFEREGEKYFVMAHNNVTERRLAESNLKESEERYRLAIDASNEGIWDYDVKTDTIKFSPAIYTMLGYEPYEFEESREAIYQLISSEDQQKWHRNYHESIVKIRDEKQFQDEYRIFTKTRELIWVQIKGKVVEWTEENTPKRIVGTHIDITSEKHKNQEILEAILRTEDRERSRIAKNIHDGLQQTLIISSLNFQSAKKEIDKLSSKTKEKFETGWEYLQNSITQSRGLSHALMPKAIADFGLIMACENLVFELEKASEFTSFRFQHNIKNDKIDNRQIEITLFRILQESTNNIIKYAQATKVEIQLREYDDIYMLTIEDNGVGFDVDAANTKMDSMGLRSMHNRLDAVNGSMDISSFPGKGTTILVEINKII